MVYAYNQETKAGELSLRSVAYGTLWDPFLNYK
jgi:hypothetical protein